MYEKSAVVVSLERDYKRRISKKNAFLATSHGSRPRWRRTGRFTAVASAPTAGWDSATKA
jgi:hypothetical protein